MVKIVRIDDNTRGKAVCGKCAAETYMMLVGDLDEIIATLNRVMEHKC